MKKRIGSKLYDTDTAICVLPEQHLFRTQHKQTYFIYDGQSITPMTYDDAAAMIEQFGGNTEKAYLSRWGDRRGISTVNVSVYHAEKLAAYCRAHGTSLKKALEDFIDSLPTE